jgi:hypothetical protein
MKHIWHLTRYDLRAFWKSAAFVTLLQIGVLVFSDPASETPSITSNGDLISVMLGFSWGVIMISLLANVALPYPAFKTTNHWCTRPIPPIAVAASRFLSALLLVVLPAALVNGINLLVAGMTWTVALDNSLFFVLLLLLVSLPVFVLAILVGGLGRFWLTLVGTFVALGLLLSRARPFLEPTTAALSDTRSTLAAMVFVVGTLAALYIAYRRRSRVQSLATIIVTAVGMGVIGVAWPWSIAIFADGDLPETRAPANLSASVSRNPHPGISSAKTSSRYPIYSGFLTLESPAFDPLWRPIRLEGLLTAGSPHKTARYLSTKVEVTEPLQHSVKIALGAEYEWVNASHPTPRPTFEIPRGSASSTPPDRFEGTVRVQTGTPQLFVELPLTLRETQRFDSALMKIVEAELFDPSKPRCVLNLLKITPQRHWTKANAVERSIQFGTYVLINRRLKQVISVTLNTSKEDSGSPVGYRRSRITLSAYIPTTAEVSAAQWFADATLGVIASTPENFFRLPVEFPLDLPELKAPAQ